MKALDRRPCFQCAAAIRALPSGVLGPVDRPPCSRQRVLPLSGGFWQAVPLRVLASHLWPGHSGPKLDWDTLFKVAVCHAKISTNYGVLLYPTLGGVARHAWLGPRAAAPEKLYLTKTLRFNKKISAILPCCWTSHFPFI